MICVSAPLVADRQIEHSLDSLLLSYKNCRILPLAQKCRCVSVASFDNLGTNRDKVGDCHSEFIKTIKFCRRFQV